MCANVIGKARKVKPSEYWFTELEYLLASVLSYILFTG